MRDPLLIPFALTAGGQYVEAASARRGDEFRCPGCGQAVTLRSGEVRQHHFAHRPGFAGHGESELHRMAKHRLAQLLRQSAGQQRPRLFVTERCAECLRPIHRLLPAFDAVEVEMRLGPDRVADVVVIRQRQPVAVFEVLVTHQTDPHRAAPPGMPWFEIRVTDAVVTEGWAVTASHQRPRCDRCPVRDGRPLKPRQPRPALAPVGLSGPIPWVSPLRGGGSRTEYAMEWIPCRNCGERARYFVWSADPPPEPRPASVYRDVLWPSDPGRRQLPQVAGRNWSGTGRGWWNHCSNCGRVLDA